MELMDPKLGVMKRFMLFTWSSYYPYGGGGDLIGSYDTIEEAAAADDEDKKDGSDIFDCENRTWVQWRNGKYYVTEDGLPEEKRRPASPSGTGMIDVRMAAMEPGDINGIPMSPKE
jgi:hypothetical protein